MPDITGSGYAEQAAEDRARGVDPFSSPEVGHDPARARALLAEAGYEVVREGDELRAKGFPPLEILYNTGEGHAQVAVAIQDMWKRHLGVSAALRSEEWRVMLKDLRDGNFQVIRLGWLADYNHPQTWLGTFLSQSPQNRSGWADAEFDEAVAEAARDGRSRGEHPALPGGRAAGARRDVQDTALLRGEADPGEAVGEGYIPNARNTQLIKWLWIDPDWQRRPAGEPPPVLELPPPGRAGRGSERSRSATVDAQRRAGGSALQQLRHRVEHPPVRDHPAVQRDRHDARGAGAGELAGAGGTIITSKGV